MKDSLVSVVILTYNGEKEVGEALSSVFKQTYDHIEIIVVDNASSDGTKEILQNTQYPRLPKPGTGGQAIPNTQVFNKKNIGFAGHNIGIEKSKGEFVLCVNQDVILDKEFITEAVKVFRRDEKIGAVQGKLLKKGSGIRNQGLGIIDTTGIVAFKNGRFVDRGQGEKDRGQYDKIEEIFGFNGAAPVFRKECLEDVKLPARLRSPAGGLRRGAQNSIQIKDLENSGEYYDPDFFMYKEDIDLSWRMRLYGWKIVYCPRAIAYPIRSSILSVAQSQSYVQIAKIRRKQIARVRYYSFKNQRLMQIKNELSRLFFKHLPWILPKEIASWFYVLFFEPKMWPAIVDLFKQMPRAWRKRKIIMTKKRVGVGEMGKWFQ